MEMKEKKNLNICVKNRFKRIQKQRRLKDNNL